MITFRPVTNIIQQKFCLQALKGLEADFFDAPIENAVFWRIMDDGHLCGTGGACCVRKIAFLRLHVVREHTDESYALLMNCVSYIISRYHPDQIMTDHYHGLIAEDLKKNMFYPIGNIYCRDTESWRFKVDDGVFDENGMIINQGLLKDLPFGWFSTREKGCGWIAAYNLFRMNGMEHTMENCARSLEKYDISGKIMGQQAFALFFWLKKEGLPVRLSICSFDTCGRLMSASKNGILLYFHSRGAHYTAWKHLGNGHIQFFNAVYGARNMVLDSKDFLRTYSSLPVILLIYIQ